MEYIRKRDQKPQKLSDGLKLDVAKRIIDDFETFDRARGNQLETASKLMGEIYFQEVDKHTNNKKKSWKSYLKTRKLYMYTQILKAFIWKNTYSGVNSMFDVSGESRESDNNSNKQKTMLVNTLEKMEYPKTCDKVIDYSLIYGELITFTTWKKSVEEFRRPISMFDAVTDPSKMQKIAQASLKGEKFYVDERVDYDDAYIYDVDPSNFVFDATQFKDFDNCPKILRSWRTPEDIIDNKFFEVSEECAQYLRDLVKDGTDLSTASNQLESSLKDKHANGSTVEVLEHWGNLRMPDDTILRNWYAVVVGGKYLVSFKKNPFIINPFTFGCYTEDPKTHRGISPLCPIYDLALTQEDMLRRTMDLQALTENPPVYAGKGFFGKDTSDIELRPGKIIEYDNNLYNTLPVKPMEFAVSVFNEDLSYLDDIMSEISGIFPNMAGASESERTTATEISTKVEGQLTRLKMILDIINNYLILPNVKKVAKLKANFSFGNETLYTNAENKNEEVVITNEVRQGEYKYTYADRSATSERFNFADMVVQACQQFLKAGVPLNAQELFIWFMGEKGVENPERFLQQTQTLAPEVQQALMQNPQLAPVIQEMQARVEMAKNGQKLPENDQPEVPVEGQEQSQELPDKLNSLPGRNLLSR